MSSVKEQEQAQALARQEAERLQKVGDKAARDAKTSTADRQAFGKLVQQGQAAQNTTRVSVGQQEQGKASERLQTLAQGLKQESLKNVRLHRDGAVLQNRALEQAKTFGGQLETKGAEAATTTKTQTNERVEAKEIDRGRVEERGVALEKKREAEKDAEADAIVAESTAKERPNAAIDAGSDRGDDSRGGEESTRLENAKGLHKGGEVTPTADVGYTREVQKIPEEILKKLVDAIYVGVNEKGLHTFRMDMKDGVLQGGSIEITVDAGKIKLTFGGLEGHTRNMVDASKGDLMRRMEKRGLTLDDIVFTER
jgi:hypothetical protein